MVQVTAFVAALLQDGPEVRADFIRDAMAAALKAHVRADFRLDQEGKEIDRLRTARWSQELEGAYGLTLLEGSDKQQEYKSFTVFLKGMDNPRDFCWETGGSGWREILGRDKPGPAALAAMRSFLIQHVLEDRHTYTGGLTEAAAKAVTSDEKEGVVIITMPGVASMRLAMVFQAPGRWETDYHLLANPENTRTVLRIDRNKRRLLGLESDLEVKHKDSGKIFTLHASLDCGEYDKSLMDGLPKEVQDKLSKDR